MDLQNLEEEEKELWVSLPCAARVAGLTLTLLGAG